MRIRTQIGLGMAAIVVLVALLGTVGWVQTGRLWEQTKGLYEHPLMVRRAIGEIKADILAMHRGMKDLCLAGDDRERERALRGIDACEADAHRQFGVVFDRYLGPRSDVEEADRAFAEWRPIREETYRLLREGLTDEAIRRTTPSGPGGSHVDALMMLIGRISEYARARGDQYYADAMALHRTQTVQLAAISGAILLACVGLVALLARNIRGPLGILIAASDEFRRGRFDARSRYAGANEFGTLSARFNALANTIQREMVLKDRASELGAGMMGALEARAFDLRVLEPLVRLTGSQVGALFVLDERRGSYEHVESIGLGPAGKVPVPASARAGEFGAALASRRITRIADIPADTRFVFSAVSGSFLPREIVTVPLPSGHEVPAVISLASLAPYTPEAIRLLEDRQEALAGWMATMLAHLRVQALSESLERQNRELEAQKRELSAQADELGEQNVELEMQKRELHEANRLKSSFLATMSHELRTPLNAVIALSGVLGRRLAAAIPAEDLGYLSVIERNGKHLLALINDLLDLSRIESGREVLSVEEFAAGELIADVVSTLEPQARGKDLAIVAETEGGLPALRSDRHKCRHVLMNLVGNAVKFTEAGSVTVNAKQEGARLRIEVIDTGIGIPADQIPHIFDEFRQGDASTSRRYGGTGLGLAIVRKYTALLQGSISVESEPGKGSTFTLELPLAIEVVDDGRPREPAGKRARGAVDRSGQGRSLLLVEDNEAGIVQITDILSGQGYEIRVARNGREALARIGEAVPDAVILDLMMPDVDGFQVLAAIRGEPATARLPVLVLTARHVTPEELSFLEGNHIHELVQKGDISRSELLAAVAGMVAPRVEPPGTARARAVPTGPGRPLILVVEDNPDNRLAIRTLLAGSGTVVEAADGREGLEAARRHRPDLILMDLSLPVMDGFEALAAIREDEALCGIPVLAVTASAMKGTREEVLSHGFDGYISKPFDEVELLRAIREVFHGA